MSVAPVALTDQQPVTLRLGDFELVISARRIGTAAAGNEGFELVQSSSPAYPSPESFGSELTLGTSSCSHLGGTIGSA